MGDLHNQQTSASINERIELQEKYMQDNTTEQSIRDILIEAHKKIQQQHGLHINTVDFHEFSRTMNGEIQVSNIHFTGEAL